jgi:hypothetical protein
MKHVTQEDPKAVCDARDRSPDASGEPCDLDDGWDALRQLLEEASAQVWLYTEGIATEEEVWRWWQAEETRRRFRRCEGLGRKDEARS